MSTAIQTRNLVHKTSLISKFKGVLVGAVVGDCLGAHFEGDWDIKLEAVKRFFAKLHKQGKEFDESKDKLKKDEIHNFTDDTAMTRSVARSLIENKDINLKDMAQKFVDEFHKESWRGYGGNVVTVFQTLKKTNCSDPHLPATKQFDGQGSYGNGAAMRISPAALFGFKKEPEDLDNLVADISKITHSHPDAILGAQLECAAVHTALHQKASLDRQQFIDQLISWVDRLEHDPDSDSSSPPKAKRRAKRPSEEVPRPYTHKLASIKRYLAEQKETRKDIEQMLGNDVSALGSVPAALFSFLLCNSPIEDFETENPFERTIMYAISLGGDTDTIATMAGAIAGGYYGIDTIPEYWLHCCEAVDDAVKMANDLCTLVIGDSEDSKDPKDYK